MSEFLETDDRRVALKNKLRQYFDGKITAEEAAEQTDKEVQEYLMNAG